MLNMNFIPEDYVCSNESRRTNVIYLALLLIMMVGVGGSFTTIKMRQQALWAQEQQVNQRLSQAEESIKKIEELGFKRKAMMKTALMTAELIEPMPRSFILASMTNNLPSGVSLLRVCVVQKEMTAPRPEAAKNSYQKAQDQKAAPQQPVSPEKLLETNMEIEGIAPSDLQVAAYLKQLSESEFLENVSLIESKEHKLDETTFREFKLTASLKKGAHISDEELGRLKIGIKSQVSTDESSQ